MEPQSTVRRVELTAMSVDIVGSMGLAGLLTQPELWQITEELYVICCKIVERFGGRVDRFTGDGVMAAFVHAADDGGPAGHAERACRAALRLRDEIHSYSRGLRYERGVPLRARIGLNSGSAIVGRLGGREETMCGFAVCMSKRVEELARPGTVCIGESTAELVGAGAQFGMRDRRLVQPRGALAPVAVHELTAVEEAQKV